MEIWTSICLTFLLENVPTNAHEERKSPFILVQLKCGQLKHTMSILEMKADIAQYLAGFDIILSFSHEDIVNFIK